MKVLLGAFALILSVLSAEQACAVSADDLSLSGSAKSLNLYLDNPPLTSNSVILSSEHFRLDLVGNLSSRAGFELSVDQQLLWTSRSGVLSLSDSRVNRLVDLEKSWREDERFSGRSEIDRMNIHGDTGRLSWAIGRQAIGFGRISLFSPLDVVAPFAPDALDTDVRPGVDAIKVTEYFGLAGQLGGIIVFGDHPDHNSYLLTAGENLNNVDLLFMGGSLRGRSLLSFGLAGEIGNVGIKAEMSWYRGKDVRRPGGDLHDHFAVAAVEGWYRFDNGLVLIGEYLYSGFGSHDPEEYPLVAASAPINEGLGFLLGKHYLLAGPSYQFHPLVTFNGLLIHNIEDRSSLFRPQAVISLADNLQLDLFWTFATGRKTADDALRGIPVIRSEFGSTGDSGGLFIRYYF